MDVEIYSTAMELYLLRIGRLPLVLRLESRCYYFAVSRQEWCIIGLFHDLYFNVLKAHISTATENESFQLSYILPSTQMV